MAFDFPATPTLGQVYTSGGASYIWTGTSWDKQTAAIYVFKAGDTMTGPLALPFDPVLNLEATTKQYVDGLTTTGLDDKVDIAGDTMTGALVIDRAGTPLHLTKPLATDVAALAFETATVPRWTVGIDAETGADAGSDLLVDCFSDTGTALGRACRMERATRIVHFDQVPTAVTIPLVQDVPMDGTQYARQDRTWAPIVLTDYVEIAGDTMTGLLILSADPVDVLGATTKQYVDGVVAAGGLYRGLWSVATNVPDLTPAVMNPVNGWSWMAQTVDPLVPETAPAGVPGIGGQTILHGDMIQWSTTGAVYTRIPGASLSITEADARYVNVPGDTLTGPLLLAADPVANLEAATKQYVDVLVATQNLYQGIWQVAANIPDLHVPPNAPLNGYGWIAVTVDPQVPELAPATIPGIGGATIFNGDVIRWNGTLLLYEQIQGSSLSAAQADLLYVNVIGDTMTGPLVLAADPVAALEATTKQYVDASLDQKVDVAGDTMTGPLLLPAPMPTIAAHATHKQYVDEAIAAQSLYQGTWQPGPNIPDLTPAVANPLHSYSWIAQTVDPLGTETPPAGIPGLSGLAIGSADTVIWNAPLATYQVVRSPAAASGFLPITGGTMTGPIVMGDLAGIHWGSTSATPGNVVTDFSEGICLYGYGGTSQFGFTITGGTLNYVVQNAGNKHNFVVGTDNHLQVNSKGCRLGLTTNGEGYYIGDNWHGMYFTGGNTMVFTEYHDRFEWRHQNSGDTPGGTVKMSLYGGNLSVAGTLTVTGATTPAGGIAGNLIVNGGYIESNGGQLYLDTPSGYDNVAMQNFREGNSVIAQFKGHGAAYEGGLRLHTKNGGWGWADCARSNVSSSGELFVNSDATGTAFTVRSSATTKHDIRAVKDDEVRRAWAALTPRRFRRNLPPPPVDETGKPLPADQVWPHPAPRLQFGFIVEDLAGSAADDVVHRSYVMGTAGKTFEPSGVDIMQVLALAVARVKLLEAEVAALKAAA